MKNLLAVSGLALLAILVVVPMMAQQHAPTAAQCQADFAVWGIVQDQIDYNKAETAHSNFGAPNHTIINRLSLKQLQERGGEMGDCVQVDSAHSDDYFSASRFYFSVVADRYFNFIERHHLMAQLKAEDTAGAR